MKKFAIALALVSTSASAAAVNGVVQDHYKNVIMSTPHKVEVCTDVAVPNHSGNPKLGPFDLEGAIIGGIIGNQIGDMKGNGTAGAVIGGLLGNNRQHNGGGYSTRRHCQVQTRYTESSKTVYSHSTITFTDENGVQRTVEFQR
jgi:uncharacterized protein YcfJ